MSPGFESVNPLLPTIKSDLKHGLGPDSRQIHLVHSSDVTCTNLLLSLGNLYLHGHDPAVKNLYAKATFPVPVETASISPLVRWNHEKDHLVTKYPEYFYAFSSVQRTCIDMMNPEWKFLSGHCIDGRILFPATGYLWITWCAFPRFVGLATDDELERTTIEFLDVNFKRATIVPKNKQVTFKITFLHDVGKFIVLESDAVCVTGRVRLHTNDSPNDGSLQLKMPKSHKSTFEEEQKIRAAVVPQDNVVKLTTTDIYKELRVRGYDYGPTFQALQEATYDGSCGQVKWTENWISFTDSVLQLAIFRSETRSLLVPTTIDYFKCDLERMNDCIKKDPESTCGGHV